MGAGLGNLVHNLRRLFFNEQGSYCIIGCGSGQYLSDKVDQELKRCINYRGLLDSTEIVHPDSELEPRLKEHVRRKNVYVVQQIYSPTNEASINDNILALELTIQAAARAGARDITAVIPYFGYNRSDRRTGLNENIRKPIGARLFADKIVAAGATGCITVDVHNDATEAFFPNRFMFDNLYTTEIFADYIKKNRELRHYLANAVAGSLDLGNAKSVAKFGSGLGLSTVLINKVRDNITGITKVKEVIGNPKGKYVLTFDDIGATLGSLETGINAYMNKGALGVISAFSIPMFVGPGIERLENLYNNGKGPLKAVIGADSVWQGEEFLQNHPFFHYVPLSPTLANAIKGIESGKSLHEILDKKKRFF